MNEKQAREIVQDPIFNNEGHVRKAEGYLEASEKTHLLAEALKDVISTLPNLLRLTDEYILKVNKAKKTLIRWEKEK